MKIFFLVICFVVFFLGKNSTVLMPVALIKKECKKLTPHIKYYTSSTCFEEQNWRISSKNGDKNIMEKISSSKL